MWFGQVQKTVEKSAWLSSEEGESEGENENRIMRGLVKALAERIHAGSKVEDDSKAFYLRKWEVELPGTEMRNAVGKANI